METATVFFTLAAIPYALDLRDPSPSWRSVSLFIVFATLGIVQKATTTGPVILILALFVIASHLRLRCALGGWRWALLFGAFATPLAIGVLWTGYAANVRAENFFGILAFPPKTYLGSAELRTRPDVWKTIFFDRALAKNAGGWLGIFLIFCAILLGTKQERSIVASAVALFVFPIVVFMNSHWWLEYYQTGTVIFLVGAVAVSAFVFQDSRLAPILACLLVLSNLTNFVAGYGKILEKNPTIKNSRALAVGDVIRRYTPENSAIVVFGVKSSEGSVFPIISYSPEIIYYSHRRGLTVARGWEKDLPDDLSSYLGGNAPGSIVMCQNPERYLRFIKNYDTQGNLFKILDCYVWLPGVHLVTLADGQILNPTSELERR